MDLSYSKDDLAFRDEVVAFTETVDDAVKERVRLNHRLGKDDITHYHKQLHAWGWGAAPWPEEYGGKNWSAIQAHIFDEVTAGEACPRRLPFGLMMVAPVIMAFGSDDQKKRFLPRIAAFDDWWCQGYSEPNAGSDLASLKTTASRNGDEYVINGQKTWTTLAQFADWIFVLAKTDTEVKAQEGISFFLVDMKSPGVSVKPIVLMDGTHEVNEVFFDEVRIPAENIVGEENMGWTYAKYLLAHERAGIAQVGYAKYQIKKLKKIAQAEPDGDQTLFENPAFKRKIADVELDLRALELTNLRVLSAADSGKASLSDAGMLKIKGSEVNQRLMELVMEAVGPAGMPYQGGILDDPGWNEPSLGPDYAPGAAPYYYNGRKISIFGGSNEIQRGIIAKAMMTQ